MDQAGEHMKVQVLQENLQRGLTIVGRAVAARSTLPITANVLLQTDRGRLKLAATDLDISICAWIGAKIDEEGATTVPSRLIGDFVSQLPPATVSIEVPGNGRQLRLECARNDSTINAMDSEDFPRIPELRDGVTLAFDPKALRRAIERVEFAAATDDSRPVLTGVHVKTDGVRLTLAAADGFRLAVADITLAESPSESVEVIIPSRALRELSRLVGESNEQVEMRINPQRTQVLFAMTDVEMVAQLIQGTFPNYNQLIPAEYTTKATVSVDEFKRETRIAAIFARDGSGIIRLQLAPGEGGQPGQLTISARADEIGDNEGKVDARVEGDASKIAFNSRYLQDVLNVLSGSVALEMTSPSSQGVFRPVDENGISEPGYVHVVMPMFVQW
ncbi:DNA polymerase III subunit beta [Candidatus Amarobacter glycogenicus]|jgi:DNA polymerase-3 subunit beta|uniref:DNA polymerase III subunit beta n=1 Tax=Candidatus Amarobacter glycogenicus TaxID=3140699 RepID=UPI0031CC76DD